MEKFITILREKGYKITPQRRAVIAVFMNCDRFATAQQILDHVKQSHPDISLDTVYRNLILLVNLGIICEIHTPGKDSNTYELITTEHHHHLVCLDCGKTECLDFCPINKESFQLIAKKQFKITSHSLEFYGYCANCHLVSE
jgi:Fur family zinc uptake transcriptional regulator